MATTTMNVSLPESLKSFVDERLSCEGYGTVSEYIRDLIRADQRQHEQEKLERLLLERLDAPGSDLNIDNVRQELIRRLQKR